MAERRMFAKTIVLSDEFLDMPPTARCLYFTLGMFADDDGFVNSPKGIMRQCGAVEDDLKILLAKKFLISFESGVIVIKHWRINNYLQKDRYKATVYTEERDLLDLDEKGNYHKKESDDKPMYTDSVYTDSVYTQDSIGKDSIGKVREGKDRIGEDKDGLLRNPCQQVVDLYHEICRSYPRLRSISDDREKAIKARLKKYTLDDFRAMFEKAEASDFLKGANERNWSATFDWLVSDRNFAKVLDGNYDNHGKSGFAPKQESAEEYLQRKAMEWGMNPEEVYDSTGNTEIIDSD